MVTANGGQPFVLRPELYDEKLTTGKTGNTRCLCFGNKINWFFAFEALPVFPVVIFRHISRVRGQKAGPLIGTEPMPGWFILKPALNRPSSCKPAQAVKPAPLVNWPPVPIRAIQG